MPGFHFAIRTLIKLSKRCYFWSAVVIFDAVGIHIAILYRAKAYLNRGPYYYGMGRRKIQCDHALRHVINMEADKFSQDCTATAQGSSTRARNIAKTKIDRRGRCDIRMIIAAGFLICPPLPLSPALISNYRFRGSARGNEI